MNAEMKKFTITTFSCQGYRKEEIVTEIPGCELIDWMKEHVPFEPERIIALLGQILEILMQRRNFPDNPGRALVAPQFFVMDERGLPHHLNLRDETNRAVLRKAQSASVSSYFAPRDISGMNEEERGIYGFARLCQLLLSINERAGGALDRGLTRRMKHMLGRCLKEERKAICDFDELKEVFDKKIEGRPKKLDDDKQKHVNYVRVRKILYAAAALLALTLLLKKVTPGFELPTSTVSERNERITAQISQMEEKISKLEEEQETLRNMLE